MELSQSERLAGIKKKHEDERKKRRGLLLKIFVAAAAVIVLVIIIIAAKGCTSDKTAKTQPAPTVAAQSSPMPSDAAQNTANSFFDNAAIVGNSFVNALKDLGLTGSAEYFTSENLSVDKATRVMLDSGKTAAESLNTKEQYERIFFSFGENELEWANSSIFISQYTAVLDKAVKYQPQSKIYLLAITPVTKEISDSDENNITNDRIREYNELIAALAAEKGAVYTDIYTAVADGDGNLPEAAAEDGIHLTGEYYEQCVSYIQSSYE